MMSVTGGTVTKKGRITEQMFQNIRPLAGVTSRRDLDALISLGNDVRGRFERIDFRSCNTGKNVPTLEKIREFFGCKQICAPDVVAFSFNMPVILAADFDKDFDKNVDAETDKNIKQGRAPVRLDPGTDRDTRLPTPDMPKTRRFDADSASGR